MRRLFILPFAMALAAGCGPTDTDEDLLTDEFEALIGTDPELADTDGDGYSDAYEHFTFFSPRKDNDFPYEEEGADYMRLPLPDGDAWDELSEDKGWDENDFTGNWTAEDQNGLELKLKRFYGQVVLVDVSAEWCNPCRSAAESLQEEYEERRDDGFVPFTILTQGPNPDSTDPDIASPSAERWEDDFGIEAPIIEDEERNIARRYLTTAYPTYTIIDREHNIVSLDQQGGTADFDLIDELLDEDPPDVAYEWPEEAATIAEALGVPVPTQ